MSRRKHQREIPKENGTPEPPESVTAPPGTGPDRRHACLFRVVPAEAPAANQPSREYPEDPMEPCDLVFLRVCHGGIEHECQRIHAQNVWHLIQIMDQMTKNKR